MKKRLLVLIATFILTFAFSTSCFAKNSPTGDVKPTEEHTTDYGDNDPNLPNSSDKSPKTGIPMAIPFVALITAAGLVLISKKEISEAE